MHLISSRQIGRIIGVKKKSKKTVVPEVAKNRICKNNKDVIVLGELEEFQTSVWGIIKKSYKGLGYKLLKKQI